MGCDHQTRVFRDSCPTSSRFQSSRGRRTFWKGEPLEKEDYLEEGEFEVLPEGSPKWQACHV